MASETLLSNLCSGIERDIVIGLILVFTLCECPFCLELGIGKRCCSFGQHYIRPNPKSLLYTPWWITVCEFLFLFSPVRQDPAWCWWGGEGFLDRRGVPCTTWAPTCGTDRQKPWRQSYPVCPVWRDPSCWLFLDTTVRELDLAWTQTQGRFPRPLREARPYRFVSKSIRKSLSSLFRSCFQM